MANTRLDRFRPLVALGVFLVAWWILPVTYKALARITFAEFHAPTLSLTSYAYDLQGFWGQRSHSKIELIEAGQELARQKARYQNLDEQNQVLEEELVRLEALLDLPARQNFRYEIARVIKRDLSAWWQEITIRKGRDAGIIEGAAVIFGGGVVGRVTEVYAYTSRIELVTSPNFRMAATFAIDGRPIVYQGVPQTGFGQPKGEVNDAPQDLLANTQAPLELISTELGGTFPAGLSIGTVSWLEPGSTGIFQTGVVKLDPRLLSLHEVTILIPTEESLLRAEEAAENAL